jgi:hypothetical protein
MHDHKRQSDAGKRAVQFADDGPAALSAFRFTAAAFVFLCLGDRRNRRTVDCERSLAS